MFDEVARLDLNCLIHKPIRERPMSFAVTWFALLVVCIQGQEADLLPETKAFARLDRNRNGLIEHGEIPTSMNPLIKEIKAYGEKHSIPLSDPVPNRSLQKDSVQTNEPIGLAQLQVLFLHRQNHRETMSDVVEVPNDKELIKYAAQLIANYDKNENQFLESEEFERLANKWIECDANHDMRLDVVEVATGLKYAMSIPKNDDGSFDVARLAEAEKGLRETVSQMNKERDDGNVEIRPKQVQDDSRRYAEAILANYDVNGNDVLDRQELEKLGDSWIEVDFDRDGHATVAEIQVRFQTIARERGTASNARPKNDASDSVANSPMPRRWIDRSLPAEPNGAAASADLTDPFLRLDADRDGQIGMHEFAKTFDSIVVRDFYRRDINRDGVISRNEWNRFLAEENERIESERADANESLPDRNDGESPVKPWVIDL